MTYESNFIANREVRFIPRGWQHPKDERGRYRPLFLRHEWEEYTQEAPDASRAGAMPDIDLLPDSETEVMAYETTSEGTPISPAFPNTPDGRLQLVNWCAEHCTVFGDHRADAEAWAAILFTDSVILVDGQDGSVRIP